MKFPKTKNKITKSLNFRDAMKSSEISCTENNNFSSAENSSEFSNIKNILVGVPFVNGLGKTKGCEFSPKKIISLLPEIWINEYGVEIKSAAEIFDLKMINLFSGNIEQGSKTIYSESKKIFSKLKIEKIDGKKAIFFGGDHSISFPIANAFNQSFKNSGFIILDAHADCMEPMKEPTHEEWLRGLIEKGNINPKQILLIGPRNIYPTELEFIKKLKIKYFTTKEYSENKIKVEKEIFIFMKKFKQLYLSLDIDIIDPVFAPGTSYEEPCGLTSREALSLFQKIISNKNIKAIDINEINSLNDQENKCIKLGAKFLAELA